MKKTKEQVIEEFNIVHNFKYDYSLSEFINNKSKIKIICPEHDIFIQRYDHHLSGSGCQKCSKNYRYTTEEYVEIVNNVHNFKYDYSLTEYIKSHNKIKVRCIKHDHIFVIESYRHLQGQGCPICYNESRCSTNEEFLVKTNNIHKNEFEYLTEYTFNKDHIMIRCKKCNNIFQQQPSKHLLGQGCPICKESKGEKKIRHFLDDNKITFETQKLFDRCKYIKKLKFDFYLPDYNICIEFNGRQHYELVKQWDNKETLNIRQIRDSVKIKFCEDNNIRLIIIHYKDINKIEKILNREII